MGPRSMGRWNTSEYGNMGVREYRVKSSEEVRVRLLLVSADVAPVLVTVLAPSEQMYS